jgi:DNA polymerase I
MLDAVAPPAFSTTAEALGPVRVVYCAEAPQARQLLKAMLKESEWVAIDIETAPVKKVAKRLAELAHARVELGGALKALKRLKAPEADIEALEDTRAKVDDEIKRARKAGLDPRRARIRLLQVYDGGDEVLVIDTDRTRAGVLKLLEGVNIIAHNAAFELAFLEHAGVAVGGIHCTLQATRLTLGEHASGLDDAAAQHLGLKLDKTLQVSDWNAPVLSREQIEYAAIDAVLAWRLAEKILPRFDVQKSAYEIQMRAVPAVVRMEARGFKLDCAAHALLIAELEKEHLGAADEYRAACQASGHGELAGAIPKTAAQKEALLNTLLTESERACWPRTEKSGAARTRRADLTKVSHHLPIRALVKLTRIAKLTETFGSKLALLASEETGRIHAHYRVAATASGRASCSGPNVQQTPQDKRFRKLFVPEPGCVFVIADYAAMEMRGAAHISGDHTMTEAFENGLDLHRVTAARMTGKAPADVTPEERKGAKAVNFGSIYGQGADGLVKSAWANFDLDLSLAEARAWQDAFAASYPQLVRWRRKHHERCEERGYIVIGKGAESEGIGRIWPKSRLGRDESYYTRCCNLPIQGACADDAMLALAYVDDRLFDAGIEGGPVAWLHDEIVLEVTVADAERAREILKQAMIDGFAETFPGAPLIGLVEAHIGKSWADKDAKENGAATAAAATVAALPTSPPPTTGKGLSRQTAVTVPKRLRVLDLYCGAGGATRGLQQAGFYVVGVDIFPQPRYPGDRFVQADAIEYLTTADLSGFDFIWASPPCQAYTAVRHAPGKHRSADLVGPTREALRATGLPYVIENVEGAPLIDPIMLCGSMFGLETHPYPDGWRIERHRLFETSFPILSAPTCHHDDRPVCGIYGGHFRDRRRAPGTNHRSGSNIPTELGFKAMGIPRDAMTVAEISDAIPPAYARFIAEEFLKTTANPERRRDCSDWQELG